MDFCNILLQYGCREYAGELMNGCLFFMSRKKAFICCIGKLERTRKGLPPPFLPKFTLEYLLFLARKYRPHPLYECQTNDKSGRQEAGKLRIGPNI
nr:hypothetical protein [Clostridia bacterium]